MIKRRFILSTACAAAAPTWLAGCVATAPRSSGTRVPAGGEPAPVPAATEAQRARAVFERIAGGGAQLDAGRQATDQALVAYLERARSRRAQHLSPAAPGEIAKLNEVVAQPVREMVVRHVRAIAELPRGAAARQRATAAAVPATQVRRRGNLTESFTVLPGQVVQFSLKGFCMDSHLPPPSRDEALYLRPMASRVPQPLRPLFTAVTAWSSTQTARPGRAQSVVWNIMDAHRLTAGSRYIHRDVLSAMDEAMPGGAEVFRRYVDSQMAVRNMVDGVLRSTGLNRHFSSNDFLGSTGNTAANADRRLAELIRAGEQVPAGKGVGYSMIAPDVAARGVGTGILTGNYQVANASDQPFTFNPLEYVAQPAGARQTVSFNLALSDLSLVSGLGQTADDVLASLRAALGSVADFFRMPDFQGDLAWLNRQPNNSSVIDRAMGKLREIDQTAPVKAVLSGTPVAGNLLALYETFSGRDWLHGDELTAAERAIAALSTIPGENTLLASVRVLDKIGELAMLSNNLTVLKGGLKAVTVGDEIFRHLNYSTIYRNLQPIASRLRTETERAAWENFQAGNERVPFYIYDDPMANNIFTWLARGAFTTQTAISDLVERVASGQVRLPPLRS